MSKQCYLLILLLLCGIGLAAEIQIQSGFYTVSGNEKATSLNQTRLDAKLSLVPNLHLFVNSKLEAADRELGEFPQKKWMHNFVGLEYTRKHWNIGAGYRNLLFGSPERLPLYPSWNNQIEFDRKAQHQAQMDISGNFGGLSVAAYGIGKHLQTTPTEFVWNNDTFEMDATEMPERGFDDLYYGMQLSYQVYPYLSINGSTDVKQANFTASEVYDMNSTTLGADVELQPIPSGKFAGSFSWVNRNGDSLPDFTRNMYQTTLRYQQSLGMQVNGFISLINNSCSDDKLSEVYLLSNQIRCHLQYHFPYDVAQASFFSAGMKHSLEREKTAFFSEGQWLLLNHFYGNLSYLHLGNAVNNYQAKLSYFVSPFSECYVQYRMYDSDLYIKPLNYLGIGTSIQL
ncbi:MAG: hypothetical protein CVU50_00890 [Candidatus Cloacimonetes bacterium HGW-Cloacimonetes-3]|jgi:hypothetical protein|nr:MAG: hypothetical protein CVU50_00890 [Candidatus Cloacimonetes bacterium HGW-Cloacimonetes-3]